MTDLRTTTPSRRQVLTWFGGLGAAAVLTACGSNGGSKTSSSTRGATSSTTGGTTATTAAAATTATTCEQIPEETAGPYPGDGTNGPNILTEDGVVRSDITSSIGSASGVAEGVPFTMDLTIVDSEKCGPKAGAAVYVWHCS